MLISFVVNYHKFVSTVVQRSQRRDWSSYACIYNACCGSSMALIAIGKTPLDVVAVLCSGWVDGFVGRIGDVSSSRVAPYEKVMHTTAVSFAIPRLSENCDNWFIPAPQAFFRPSPILRARRMRGGRRTRHREPNPGDWLCQCGETNYRSKRECFKCGAPAPPLPPGVRRPSLPGEDPNDWACACGQMNFRGSVVCHKCSQPKPVPPGQETTPLWTCPTCKGINREHRKTCFKCGAVSPNVAFSCLQEGSNGKREASSSREGLLGPSGLP